MTAIKSVRVGQTISDERSRVQALSDEELRSFLDISHEKLGEAVVQYATAVAEWLRRGKELRGISQSFIDTLVRIDSGQVDREMAQRYIGCSAMRYLKLLTLDAQREIMKTGGVEFVESEGKPGVLMARVDLLNPDQIRQIFASGRIRSAGEQRAWLAARPRREKPSERLVAISLEITEREAGRLKRIAKRRNSTIDGLIVEVLRGADLI